MPPNLSVLPVLQEDTNPPGGADPHLPTSPLRGCVFWVWAKHSIWQFLKELCLPKCSEAEGPVGQGSVALRRGNWRWNKGITASCSQLSQQSPPMIPARVPQPSKSKKTGNVPLSVEWVTLEAVQYQIEILWYQTTAAWSHRLRCRFPALPTVFPPIYNQPSRCGRAAWSPLLILYTTKALTRSAGHYENRSQSCQSQREEVFYRVRD